MVYYKSAIVKESERWLLLGRPIPLFVFTPAGPPPHKYRPLGNVRDLAPDGSGEKLIPLDYYESWEDIKNRFPEGGEGFPRTSSQRYATIVMFEGAAPTLMRLDLGHNRTAIEAVEEQKMQSLQDFLREFHLATTHHDHNHSPTPLEQSIEALLARLLQRPAAEAEIERVLEMISCYSDRSARSVIALQHPGKEKES